MIDWATICFEAESNILHHFLIEFLFYFANGSVSLQSKNQNHSKCSLPSARWAKLVNCVLQILIEPIFPLNCTLTPLHPYHHHYHARSVKLFSKRRTIDRISICTAFTPPQNPPPCLFLAFSLSLARRFVVYLASVNPPLEKMAILRFLLILGTFRFCLHFAGPLALLPHLLLCIPEITPLSSTVDVDGWMAKLVVKKSDPENMILNGRAALCAGRNDMSSEDDGNEEDETDGRMQQQQHQHHHHRFAKPQDNFKMCLENGVIPDAAMIHAARKRRQKAREQGKEG